jgi:hypothetical protein
MPLALFLVNHDGCCGGARLATHREGTRYLCPGIAASWRCDQGRRSSCVHTFTWTDGCRSPNSNYHFLARRLLTRQCLIKEVNRLDQVGASGQHNGGFG